MPRFMKLFLKTGQKTVKWLAITALVVYGAVVGYFYAKQREMLFEHVPDVIAPNVLDAPLIEDIRLKTPDGETLRAWYLPPRDDMPIVLYLGGQGGGLHEESGRYRRMAQNGVGFLSLSYRSYAGSTGTPSEQGFYADAASAYDWLISQGYKADHIVVHGYSLGSGVATWLVTQRPAKSVILEAPFTAAVDVAQERYPYLPVKLLMKDRFASRERIGDIGIPVLIVHGDRDTVVPFHFGTRLFDLARQPKTFVRFKGSDHATLTRDGVYEKTYFPFMGVK